MLTRMLAAVLAVASGSAGAAEIELLSRGGEAWSFEKRIEGRAAAECDEIVVTSPAGSVRAWREGERFAAVVPLDSGPNEVQAACRRDGADIAVAAPQQWTVALADAPKAWVRTRVADGTITLDAGRSEPAPRRRAAIVGWEWRAAATNPAPLTLGDGPRLALRPPAVDGEYHVTLRVIDALGRSDESTAVFRVRGGKPEEVDLASEHPDWAERAVVYGVVPFLFGPRGLPDVTARLDEIAALGATVLWLSPITDAPDDDFGYAVTDHRRLRGRYGSEAELRELVAAAHARGLKVIMDFVPNHVSDRHRWFADAERHGERSPYHGFFERDGDGGPVSYFDWDHLKNLDFDNPEVRRYVVDSFAHWVREVDIDGFRADVSWGVRERAPEFWPQWREELKRIKPGLLLIAESSARDPYYVANGFDAAYDWTDELGRWAWQGVWSEGKADLAALRAALAAPSGPDSLVFRFLNNNDTGRRFADRHGLEVARVAATLLFTLPGIPLIYSGDELAAAYEPYDEGPPLDWTAPAPLAAHYRRLAELRRSEPELRSRHMAPVATDRDDAVLAFRRGDLLVLLNFGGEAVTPRVAELGPGPWLDLLGGTRVSVPELAPYGALVLRPLSLAPPAAAPEAAPAGRGRG